MASLTMCKIDTTAPKVDSDGSPKGYGESPTPGKTNDDPDAMSEDEKKRIMRMIEEDSSDEDDDNDSDALEDRISDGNPRKEGKAAGSDNDSFCSDNDILNRELEIDADDPLNAENYLRYASDKYNAELDILKIIDKNERSFKQVAEKMIQQSSQLEMNSTAQGQQPQRKLMTQKVFKKIADRFHGDAMVAQGVPYSIAALEDFIAIGSSDGSIRLFDHSEQEITMLVDKKVKGSAVTCLDMRRIGEDKHIYIVSGHMRGQIAIYKVEGLLE